MTTLVSFRLEGFSTVAVTRRIDGDTKTYVLHLESMDSDVIGANVELSESGYNRLTLEDMNWYDDSITSKDQIATDDEINE